ncbi:PEP-CTERM sorting domain-containing protein [Janthinobacterium sp. BJB412]|nr:PEP-CTERM sorting domain-containing protein [Janthinobacterium sp. BJB412]
MTPTTFVARLLPVLLGTSVLCSAQAAVSSIDLGAAAGYSGFFYNNVTTVVDVEGRLAVGGNLYTSGLSVGYRTPYGVTGPSLVVGGNAHLSSGDIFTGPASNVNTNASEGPITEYKKETGYGVFGGSKVGSSDYHDLRQQTGVIDFAAAKTQLTKLSTDLNNTAANGTVELKWGGIYLTGDNTSDLQVFNVNSSQLGNLTLQNVKSTANVVINVTGGGMVTFSGGQDGQMVSMRDRLIYNLVNATDISMSTYAYGTVLANNAVLSAGAGHLEGNIIAKAMTTKVEIGFEPYKAYQPTSPVPEPETYAMLLAGLGLVGFLARRRKAA